jgi:hypothetical protein
MDPTTFDTLTRSFGTTGSRRRLLRLGSALLSVGLLTALLEEGAEAGRRHRRSRRNRRQSGNHKANRKGQRKDQAQDQPRPLNCPDQTISCYSFDSEAEGLCGPLVHEFPAVGHCGIFTCCPCEHPDPQYWWDLCNQTVPEKCKGNCYAQDGPKFSLSCFGCPI